MTIIKGWFKFYFHYEPFEDEQLEPKPNWVKVSDDTSYTIVSCFRFWIEGKPSTYKKFLQNYDTDTGMQQKMGEMEEHGVHDVYIDSGELEGFDSYEIAPDDQQEVMDEWRDWFIKQGFACGPMEMVTVDEEGNIPEPTPAEQEANEQFDEAIEKIRQSLPVVFLK